MLTLPWMALLVAVDGGASPREQLTSTDWCMPVFVSGFKSGGNLRLQLFPDGKWTLTHSVTAPRRTNEGRWTFERGKIRLVPLKGAPFRLSWISRPNPYCTIQSRPECASTSPIQDVLMGEGPLPYVRCERSTTDGK